ncbi:hypothetical protein Ahy_B09g095535 isoform Q [Arachis hypogaea]|uniref:Uncharacterized protein n=1 Tax=Arachis hypogaea TaxID=3818 RepID=A0A444XEN2_ARAHY|nr:hypothetical protein Ahy_B09g095535 isoform Q [Arachis hypogaea]
MALSDHPNGEFVSPKTKKEFRVEAYPSFIPFIDRKKLTSHPYVSFRLLNLLVRLFTYLQNKITHCSLYVMKWMELIEPENEEVDHYRVEYASRILFSEMNKQRDRAIRESSAIRLSKPSSVLLSPFCQINSADIETG